MKNSSPKKLSADCRPTVGRQSADTITLHTSKLKSVSNINHKRFICRPLKRINNFIYFTLKQVKHTM